MASQLDAERVKFVQSDEKTIYEEGVEPLNGGFCSIMIDGNGGLSDELLPQRIEEIARRREELDRIEVELRARAIARSEVLEMQNGYESKIKEHVDVAYRLKEQLQERERQILELEIELDEKDKELRAVKIDTEAAWAKEDLFREQNKELTTFRREHNNMEAERAQHLQNIRDLQEHIKEKESQFLALEEQHSVTQETIILKDDQLREAQAWIPRFQEMDVVHSNTNQWLQAELRERTEQFNQYWLAFQRQFSDVERVHLQTIHHLQLELAEARELNGVHKNGSQSNNENLKDNSSDDQSMGNQANVDNYGVSNANLESISNGNLGIASSNVSASSSFSKNGQFTGVPDASSSVMGMNSFLPHGQVTALQPFFMHPQDVPLPLSCIGSPNPQSLIDHSQPGATIMVHHWQNDQATHGILQVPNQEKHHPSQTEQNLSRPDAHYSYQHPAEGQIVHPDILNTSINLHQTSQVVNGSSDGSKVLESNGNSYQAPKPQESVNSKMSFQALLGHDPPKQKNELKDENGNTTADATDQSQGEVLTSGQQWAASGMTSSTTESHPLRPNNVAESNDGTRSSSSLMPGKTTEPTLLDERSILACIVRAIPAGSDGRIRISTTLPNRLGKMLAPLHWHDYKKYYGKLDDLLARHPELFVIEGDYIHLREGAQGIISATTAYAKVAAAAASSAPYSSLLPSVALTPVAQNNHHKKAMTVDSRSGDAVLSTEGVAVTNTVDSCDVLSHSSRVHNKKINGLSFNIAQEGVKIPSKSRNLQALNDPSSETRPNLSSTHITVRNGANHDRSSLAYSQNKALGNGRQNFGGKQLGRSSGSGSISRR